MRIYAVTSIHVSATELARRQARYDRVCPPGTTVELHDLGADAPVWLGGPDDVRESERLVAEALRAADGAGYDVLLPDCVLDPGVTDLAGELTTPVHGLLRLTLEHVAAAERSAGAVMRNRLTANELAIRVAAYGREDLLVATSVLDLDRTALSEDTRWLAALGTAVNELADAGAEIVLNGCCAVELDNARSGRVPVVDPAALALRQLAVP